MTNDELKKKIFSIVRGAMLEADELPFVETTDNIADALIAAGIGDVSELKKHKVVVEKSLIPEDDNAYVLPNIPPTVKQLYSGEEVEQIVKEREEYKHRAEVAEKALYCLARSFAEAMCKDGDTQHITDGFINDAYKQAEKELAEEGKDE